MIEINANPSRREVWVFAALWLLFFAAVGGVAVWKSGGLLVAATFLTLAWLVSLVFHSQARTMQLAGVALPLLFGLTGGAVRWGVPGVVVLSVLGGIGLVGAAAIASSYELGRRVYVGWMVSVFPISWTVSTLILALVYFGILTPIGVLMRMLGHDPMRRRFERSASSYWIERSQRSSTNPFRQF